MDEKFIVLGVESLSDPTLTLIGGPVSLSEAENAADGVDFDEFEQVFVLPVTSTRSREDAVEEPEEESEEDLTD